MRVRSFAIDGVLHLVRTCLRNVASGGSGKPAPKRRVRARPYPPLRHGAEVRDREHGEPGTNRQQRARLPVAVYLREAGGEPQRFIFSVAERCGANTEGEVADLIRRLAAPFANGTSALAQFREREHPHPPDSMTRRAIPLGYE